MTTESKSRVIKKVPVTEQTLSWRVLNIFVVGTNICGKETAYILNIVTIEYIQI